MASGSPASVLVLVPRGPESISISRGRMPERGDFLVVEGGTGCHRAVEGGVQHQATAQRARQQAASPRGLQPSSSKSNFTAYGCDVDSLMPTRTKTRPGQCEENTNINSHWECLGEPVPPHGLQGILWGQTALILTAVAAIITGLLGCDSSHAVNLSWNPSTSVVVGYNVYRGTQSGGPYTKLNPSPVAATTYTDSTVQSGQTYFYAVKAVNPNKVESVFSQEVSATIPANTFRRRWEAVRKSGWKKLQLGYGDAR